MNVCPQCGTINRPGAHFCRQCRSVLLSTATLVCPYCGAALRPDARFCKRCGKPVSTAGAGPTCPHCGGSVRPQALFCPYCGAPLVSTAARRICPHCSASVRAGARFCPQCRTPLTALPTPVIVSPPPLPPSQQPGRFGTGDLLPTTTIANRYVILEKIAQGGMGAVYKAQDKRLQGKIVAVKEMSESAIPPADREKILKSFQREAELLARLEHPNLARVTDYFQEGERHYMVMEFIEGQTLKEMLEGRTEPFPEEQVLIWAEQLCDVLSYLHSQTPKIIYRDVKPANVMVLDGSDEIKLIDFGIARFYKPGKRKDTIEFGTDGYAPPEQYGKAQTDERADIHALGAMLHQLLTLRDPATVLFQFPPVRSLNPKVSRRVGAAIAKAVEPNKDKRHQSIEEMRAALLGDKAAKRRRAPMKKKPARPTTPSAVPPSVPGQLVLAPASVDFGRVSVGGDVSDRPLVVTFPAGERATLDTDAPWLHVHPRSVSKRGSRVTVTLDTTRLEPGRLQLGGNWLKRWAGWHTCRLVPAEQKVRAHVKIELKSGPKQRVPVSVTVVPQPWQVQIGWVMTVGAMLLEAAVIGGVLWALVVAMLG